MRRILFLITILAIAGGISAQNNNNGQVIIPDSVLNLLMTELEPLEDDSVKAIADSLSLEIDSLNVDPWFLMEDSLAVDSLAVDSLAAKKDTAKVKKDSLSVRKVKVKPLKEVVEFYRLMRNYKRYRLKWTNNWNDIYIVSSDVKSNPEYYKYMMPATYYYAPVYQSMSIDEWRPELPYGKDIELTEYPGRDLRTAKKVDDYINRQMLSFYLEYPDLVHKNESTLRRMDPLSNDMMVWKPKTENLKEMAVSEHKAGPATDKDLLVFKPNFWTFVGNGFVQFSQYHVSDNWYKGGESTNSLLSGIVLQANYDDKQKVQFENRLEWKLGFTTTPSDTLHSYKVNNDMLRLSSKLGLRAIKNWYYTVSAEFKTQFFSNYQTNSNNIVSAFFSPAELNVGIGMDYKYVKNGKCNLSVLLNPLNYTLHSVSSNRVDPTKFNIEKGHKKEHVFGSRMEALMKWKILHNLMWESRLSYTTNYEKVLGEWENTFTFSFNKYISSKLFILGRYDDGVNRKEGDSYYQLQELLSIGLNYTW